MQLQINNKKDLGNYLILFFEKPQDFSFYPGQYLDIEFQGDTRAFTISSSPSEDYLMITAKKGLSKFKKALEGLKNGDYLSTSHPAGTFILDETSPAVFLAGGIGITPFRSIIKYCLDQKISTPITIIHSNSDDNFLFKDELEKWKNDLPKLTIIYYNSTKKGRLDKEKFQQLYPKPYTLNPIYYLAGSHSFVNDMEKTLIKTGIDQSNIRYDRFDGYA